MDTTVRSLHDLFRGGHRAMEAACEGAAAEALNWRPAAGANTISGLVHHAVASERFWLRFGLGLPPMRRDREAEFASEVSGPAELLALVRAAETDVEAALGEVDAARLGEVLDPASLPFVLPDAPKEITRMWCVIHALEHAREHAGQMMLTRQLWDNGQR